MDIIDFFLESHAALRGDVSRLEAPLKRAHGVGWDDCVAIDQKRLLRDVNGFFDSFKKHEMAEDDFLAEVSGQLVLDAQTRAAFAEGRRALSEIMKLFGAVVFSCDGEHVHRVRELLSRLRQELEAHLSYEEKILFPLLRDRLPEALLRELGAHARAGGMHGPPAR